MMRKKRGWALLLMLLGICLSLLPGECAAADEGARVVRVGYSSSGSMLYRDSEGRYRGYDAIYLYEVARYTGWRYEFVPYDNWSQAVADVAAGRIDILPTVIKTPQREQQMLFSLQPMAATNIAIIKRPDDTRYVYGNIKSTADAVIGVRSNTADTRLFEAWAGQNGLTYQERGYNDRSDLLAALRDGSIDIAATSYAGEAQKFPAIAEFSPQNMYFAIAPQHPELASELDQAVSIIRLYHQAFFGNISDLGQLNRNRYQAMVSNQERAYIDALPPLRVAMLRDNAPFSYERDGEVHGVAARVLERLSEMTGLKFQYVLYDSHEQAREALLAGDVDIIGNYVMDYTQAYDDGLRLTAPYCQKGIGVLKRKGTDGHHLAAIASIVNLLQSSRAGDFDYETAPSGKAAMEMLLDGRVEAIAGNMATISYYASMMHRGDYELDIMLNVPAEITMVTRSDADQRLYMMLDRMLNYIKVSEINEIVQQETSNAPLSFLSILDRMSGSQFGIFVSIAIFVHLALIYLIWMLWHSRKLERRMARVEREYDSMNSTLDMEKNLANSQRKFYGYLNTNVIEPIKVSLMSLIRAGAAEPDSPLHADYLRCGIVNEFMVNVHFLNALIADEVSMNEWQSVGLLELLRDQGRVIAGSARRKPVNFTVDFSGIGQESVIIDKRFFNMTIIRLMSIMLKNTPADTDLLMSGSMSSIADSDSQGVLWLFCTAPHMQLSNEVQRMARNISEKAHENPHHIYDCLSQIDKHSIGEQTLLINIAILELLIMMLGGEWHIQYSPEKGTEVTIELLLDIAEE